MDQSIRNKLRGVVTQCRKLLEEAVSQVLQGQFGIYASGKKDEVHVEDEGRMKNLSDEDKGYRRDIQAHLGHIEALGYKANDSLAQLVREIAFTHLNRLCAYKMMEAREVWIGGKRFREAVSRGMKSQGFLFYLADHPEEKKRFDTGHQDVAYRHFLGWLGALLSEEIGVLFSPTDPANRLFPPQRVLDDVLALLNSDDLKDIWAVDETIGWVYQYFTPKELRDQVRKESAAPRNSYELAFHIAKLYPRTKHDLYASFVERGLSKLECDGFLGAITSRTGFFLSTFQKWREELILGSAAPSVFADLGYGVLDTAMVETASFCLRKDNHSAGAYIRLLSEGDKEVALLATIRHLAIGNGAGVSYIVAPTSFSLIPGSPFAYWLTESLRKRFRDLPKFESEGRALRIGDHPGDGFRWLRLHSEVSPTCKGRSWLPYHKGGTNSPFFDDVPLVVDWDDQRQTYRGFFGRKGRPNERPSNYQCFLKPGITFPYLPHKRGHFAHVPPGGIFGHASPILQLPREQHWAICGLLNSRCLHRASAFAHAQRRGWRRSDIEV